MYLFIYLLKLSTCSTANSIEIIPVPLSLNYILASKTCWLLKITICAFNSMIINFLYINSIT